MASSTWSSLVLPTLEVMRKRWPRTLAYLNRFRTQLERRSGNRRYFKPADPFYAIYNVSAESVVPLKVAWRTMGSSMQATTLGRTSLTGGLTEKPTVFKNTVVYVPVESEEEAFYLTALLNCTWANYLLRASKYAAGKSAFATNVLDTIAIPTYRRRRPLARDLAALGARASAAANAGDDEQLAIAEARIDETSARFWDISTRQQRAMDASLRALA